MKQLLVVPVNRMLTSMAVVSLGAEGATGCRLRKTPERVSRTKGRS
jgi:hypothetical protein